MNKIVTFSLIATTALVFSGCQQQPQPAPQFSTKPLVLPKAKKVEAVTPLLTSKVALTDFTVNKPLLFRPFDKSTSKKRVYLSYIGLTTQQLNLKRDIEQSFRKLGYNISTKNSTSDLFVAIYMTNNKTSSTKIGHNKIDTKTYNFDIHLEQHIQGKTSMSERYSRDTVANGSMSLVQTPSKEEATKQQSFNNRDTQSTTDLPYYIFKEEAKVTASFKITNMQDKKETVNNKIRKTLAFRLAKLLDF